MLFYHKGKGDQLYNQFVSISQISKFLLLYTVWC